MAREGGGEREEEDEKKEVILALGRRGTSISVA